MAIAMRIDRGEKGGVSLGGVKFIMMLLSPGPMDQGNFTAGLIIDEDASDAQVEAIGEITSGTIGGPMAVLGSLVSTFAGVQ